MFGANSAAREMVKPSTAALVEAIIEWFVKPLRMVNENDFQKCMKLNLFSAVEVIKAYQDSLKKKQGFNNIIFYRCC